MNKIEFKCKIITPLFGGGANPSKDIEIRAQSIKGLLRFWWRASYLSRTNNKDLVKRETEIFGGTDEKIGGSRVKIKVVANIKGDNVLWDELDHKTRKSQRWRGIFYLLYSALLPDKERKYFGSGKVFSIIFMGHKEILKHYIASLWCLTSFGGIGTRTRRGSGSFYIEDIIDESSLLKEIGLKFTITGNVSEWIVKNYQIAYRIINDNNNTINYISGYSNLGFSRFIVSKKGFSDWESALNECGNIFKNFRDRNKHRIFDTAVFGFPIVHRRNISAKIRGYKNINGDRKRNIIARRSSPIIFKIIKSNEEYYWICLRLMGQFLPDGNTLYNSNNGTKQKPDYTLIDEFWNLLNEQGKEKVLILPTILSRLIEKINSKLSPKKIILFGSKASGNFNKKSDIDIAVDTDKNISSLEINGNVDIVDYNNISNALNDRIQLEGVTLK